MTDQPTSSNSQYLMPILPFRLGTRFFALPVSDIVEVAAMVALAKVPDADPALMGIANRHGDVLPVLDLRCVFEMESQPLTTATLFIVAQRSARSVGLVVDEVFQVKYIEPDRQVTAPGAGRYVRHIVSDGTDLIQMISLDPILAHYLPDSLIDSPETDPVGGETT